MKIIRFACLVFILAMIPSFLVGCGNAEKIAVPTKGKQQQAEKGNLKEKLPPQAKNSLPQQDKLNEAAAKKQGDMIRIAEGVGGTETEALKDAWRKAIWQSVGVYVDAEPLIKNDEIISDKVLNYSNGVITKYEEIAKTNDGGLVRVTIKAQVEPRPLVALLKHNNIAVRNIDGKSIYANIMTRKEAAKDARLLMEKVLNGYPWNLYTARIISQNIQESGNAAKLNFRLEVKINPKEYSRFIANLKNTLAVISRKHSKGLVINPKKPRFAKGLHWRLPYRPGTISSAIKQVEKGNAILWINSFVNQSKTRFEWEAHVVDESVIPALQRCVGMRHKVQVTIVDASNKPITPSYHFVLSPTHIIGGYCRRSPASDCFYGNILVAPILFPHAYTGGNYYCQEYRESATRGESIPLTLNELKQLDHIEVSLVPN